MKNFGSVEAYIRHNRQWWEELTSLRGMIRSTDLVETLKWGFPVYTIGGKNVVGLASFKSYVGLWFFQGALLKDTARKLINAQEGRTKAMRQWRLSSLSEIDEKLVKTYLKEAIDNQKAGREVKPEKRKQRLSPSC